MTTPIGQNFYRKGDHNVISDDSGQKFKRSQMRMNWKGQMVSLDEYEPKHPQLTIRPKPEKIAVKDARTQAPDPAVEIPFDINLVAI